MGKQQGGGSNKLWGCPFSPGTLKLVSIDGKTDEKQPWKKTSYSIKIWGKFTALAEKGS